MTATLYEYWRSSAAYRIRIALGLLKLAYRSVPVDLLAGEHRGAAHMVRNPQGLVPALEIDGRMLTQSLAILEYLDETRTAGWLPPDTAGRARVRALSYAIAMEIHPICNLSVARHAVAESGGAITMQGWMQHFMGSGLAALERMLDNPATGPYCHGDHISLADICLVPQLYNAERWGVDFSDCPRMVEIFATLRAIPAFAAAHPDRHSPDHAP